MTTANNFEVAKFHGIDVAIFDSHWFANEIISKNGSTYMCLALEDKVRKIINAQSLKLSVKIASNYAAMAPYRDFMAVCRSEDIVNALNSVVLLSLFNLYIVCHNPTQFRISAARKMLAAEPVRYCIPLEITTN